MSKNFLVELLDSSPFLRVLSNGTAEQTCLLLLRFSLLRICNKDYLFQWHKFLPPHALFGVFSLFLFLWHFQLPVVCWTCSPKFGLFLLSEWFALIFLFLSEASFRLLRQSFWAFYQAVLSAGPQSTMYLVFFRCSFETSLCEFFCRNRFPKAKLMFVFFSETGKVLFIFQWEGQNLTAVIPIFFKTPFCLPLFQYFRSHFWVPILFRYTLLQKLWTKTNNLLFLSSSVAVFQMYLDSQHLISFASL